MPVKEASVVLPAVSISYVWKAVPAKNYISIVSRKTAGMKSAINLTLNQPDVCREPGRCLKDNDDYSYKTGGMFSVT